MHEPGLDQEIRFLETGAGRIAYASVGSGPPLILPALWISHLELEWGFPELRTFITGLAGGRQVIRYDRIGTGLSDRASVEPSLEAEVQALEALTAEIGSGEVDLLGISFGGCTAVEFAARHPAKVRRVALFGAYARGDDVAPPALREALLATVRAHWGAGSRALADIWIPGANASVRARFAELQRESATAEVAAAALEAVYAADVSETARRVGAPALVLHRKRDRAIPFACGRELAALLPDGRLHALAGDTHLPWLGDQVTVVRAVSDFLADEPTSAARSRDRQPAQRARAGGPATGRRRPHQRADRTTTHRVRPHRAPARRQHPAQAQPAVSRCGRQLRGPPRADLTQPSRPGPSVAGASAAPRPARVARILRRPWLHVRVASL